MHTFGEIMFTRLYSLTVLFALVVSKNEDYMGYKVYNIKFHTQEQQDNLHLLKSDIIDFWRKPCVKYNVTGRVMVPPSHFDWFEERLVELDIARDVYIEDVFQYLSDKDQSLPRTTRNGSRQFNFDGYYRYDEILDYLTNLQEVHNNTTTTVELVEYGVTEQNRPLVYLRVANNNTNTEKPIVIIEAGINPREWITIPAALFVVNKLVDDQARLLDDLEWIIIPVLNPDGYEYTHTNLRLWTKSRSTRSNLGAICPGVNINRNFDIDWLISDSSSSPCSNLYGGTEPFSEPESQLIKSLLEEYTTRIGLYVSIKNNGGFVTYPWQYEQAASAMFRDHYLLGLDIIDAMVDDYRLDVASVAIGDRISGTSTDYVRSDGVLLTYNIEIVGKGDDGVIIPEEDISGIVEDVWRAVSTAASGLIELNS